MGSLGIGKILKGLQLSPVMQQSLGTIADSGDQRAAFNAVLLATAANVDKKPNFNLELEINDLFIRLGNLRSMSSGPASAFQGSMQTSKQIFGALNTLSANLDTAIQSIVKSLR